MNVIEDLMPVLVMIIILLFRLARRFSKKKNHRKGGAGYGHFKDWFEDDLVGDPTYSFLSFNVFHHDRYGK